MANFTPQNSLQALRSSSIEEILAKTLDTFLPALDAWGKKFVNASKGTVPAAQLGRDYLYIKHFQPGMASTLLRPTSANGDVYLYGDRTSRLGGANGRLARQQQTRVLPTGDMVNPVPIRMAIGCRGFDGAIQFTYDELQLAAQDAVLGPTMVSNKLKGVARQVAQHYINAVYADPSTNYRLATVGGTVSNLGNRQISFTITSRAYDRFFPGQPLDFFNGSTQANVLGGTRIRTFVDSIDGFTGVITVSVEADTNILSDADFTTFFNSIVSGTTYVVDPANADTVNATFNGIAGLNAWLKFGDGSGATNTNDNCLLGADRIEGLQFGGAVNVNVHPEFKSLRKDMAGEIMTEHQFRLILDQWYRHHGKYGHYIDTALWSTGALRAYEQTKVGQIRREQLATSQLMNEGAASGLKFEHDGRVYDFDTSNAINSGECYIVRSGGGNFKRVIPPSAAGTKSAPFGDEGLGLPIRLLAPALTGQNTVLAQNSAGRHLLATDMPFACYMQWMPEQAAGLKIINIGEDRLDA